MKSTVKAIMNLKTSVFLLFMFMLLPLSWYGIYSWFFTGKVLTNFILGSLFILSLFMSLMVARKHLPRVPRKKYKIRKPILVPAVFIFLPIILWLPVGMGMPALISLALAPDEIIHARVTEVKSNRSRRSCDHEIEFENISSFLKSGLCVGRHEVNIYRVGDILTLDVNNSFLGLRIYALHKSNG